MLPITTICADASVADNGICYLTTPGRQGRGNLISIGLVSLLGRSHLLEALPDCICSYGDIYRNSISEVY